MIVINTDRGLQRILRWEDVETLPGYREEIDPAQSKPKQIIGRYQFQEKVKCGLSGCRTPHNRGYVVTTQHGEVTNMGKDCGKKHFGVDFEEIRRTFDRDMDDAERREQLTSYKSMAPGYLDQVAHLRGEEKGADWANRAIRHLLSELSATVRHHLGMMIRSRNSQINVDRRMSVDEVNALILAGELKEKDEHKPQYVQEPAGYLEGLSACYPESDLRELVILDLQEHLKALCDLDVDLLSSRQLLDEVKWAGQIEHKLDRAKEIILEARRLITKGNLLQLVAFTKVPEDKKSLERLIKKLC